MYSTKKCEHDMIWDECLPCMRSEIEDLRDEITKLPAPLLAMKQICKQSDIYVDALAQIAQNAETLEQAQDMALLALHSRWSNQV